MSDRGDRAELKEIRRFLGENHLSQRRLAELAEVQPVTVSRWLNGHTLPYRGQWERIRALVLDRLEKETPDGWQQLLTKPTLLEQLGVDDDLLLRLREVEPELFDQPVTLVEVRALLRGVELGLKLRSRGEDDEQD